MSQSMKPRLVSAKLNAIRQRRNALIRLANAILTARRRKQDKAKVGILKDFYLAPGTERTASAEKFEAHEEAKKSIIFLLDESDTLKIRTRKRWIFDSLDSNSGYDERWFEIEGVMEANQAGIDKIGHLHWQERMARREDEGAVRPRKGEYGKKTKTKKSIKKKGTKKR